MRVTKNIREYIEREVYDRLAPKYEAERQEAKRQISLMDEFQDSCLEAAKEAFNDCFEKHFYKIAEFAEDRRPKNGVLFSFNAAAIIRNYSDISSVHSWDRRRSTEAREIANRIILELELGGSKEELMKMLDEIGKKED